MDVGCVIKSHCSIRWESWRVVPQETKDAVLYELSLSNLDSNDLCSSRFTQWKSDLHKHYDLYEWKWLCGHFQDEKYLKKVKANSINRSKKKLIHRSGSRHFSYRLKEKRKGSQSFLKLTCSRRCTFSPGMS
ncbi:uncharacterized protein LOC126604582 [Malus sylvestris]|uniref:uncharacterized protein LOC126604582 n=1 Tax=Malus sylvestris TaxID=3752 RepID=UPI0021ACC584|nr:uncharacterized protein LOC126604582 [Malus sylvestris]